MENTRSTTLTLEGDGAASAAPGTSQLHNTTQGDGAVSTAPPSSTRAYREAHATQIGASTHGDGTVPTAPPHNTHQEGATSAAAPHTTHRGGAAPAQPPHKGQSAPGGRASGKPKTPPACCSSGQAEEAQQETAAETETRPYGPKRPSATAKRPWGRNEPKRQRTGPGGVTPRADYAEAVKADLLVAVTNATTGHLSQEQSDEVQKQLLGLMSMEARQPTENLPAGPIFRGKPTYGDGSLRLWCEDQATLDWLRRSAATITLDDGVKVVIKRQSDIPKRVRCGILFPGVYDDFGEVGRFLRYQNPWAEVDRWLLNRREVQGTETFAVVSVPETVVQPLVEHGRRLGFMLGSVYVKFQGPRGKFGEQPPSKTIAVTSGEDTTPAEPMDIAKPVPEDVVPVQEMKSPARSPAVSEEGEEGGEPVSGEEPMSEGRVNRPTEPPSISGKFLQANLHHSETATAQIRKWLEDNTTAVILIQEPWVRRGTVCGLRNLGDLCAIKLHGAQNSSLKEMVVASVYMPEADDPPPHDLTRLVNYCEEEGLELIVATDSNAHHPLWGMTTGNERGKKLVEYLFTTNLNILNTGSEPTFVNKRSRTIIDLTLATEEASKFIAGWHVSKEMSCSDHRWIRFDIQVETITTVPRRNPRKTNRELYTLRLSTALAQQGDTHKIEGTAVIEEQVSIFTNTILECYHQTCPLSTPPATKRNKNKNNWWGPELERLRGKMRRQYNRAMNTCNDEDWDNYRSTKATYKKRLRYRSTNSWRKFCTEIESTMQANRVRKVLSNNSAITLGSLRKPDNSLTTSPEEAELVLVRTHFPDCVISHMTSWDEVETTPTEDEWQQTDEVINPQRTQWAINSFDSFKSPGKDEIFPALLKWGGEALTIKLTNILRACLAHTYVPKQWREVKVIFIPKPGKSDYSDPKAFRPISLTSFLLKTLERLCDRYLRERVLNIVPLHPNQHAYSPGKSTESALHAVVSKIEVAIKSRSMCLGTFIDIEGAFDKTRFSSITAALVRHGVSTILTTWINNMLSQRVITLGTGEAQQALVAKGCPQGGVLSPLLWNLVVNDLISTLNNNHYYTIGYADDIVILTSGNHTGTVCDVTRSALAIVERWCADNELTVNPNKTELVMFTNKRNLGNFRLPRLFNTELQLSTEVKYLGVLLDNKLNWSNHLNSKIEKATVVFWQCRRMVGRTWGLTPKITLWLYQAVIRPIISYGAIVWWPRTNLSTVEAKLQRLQRLACMATTGCMRTTPTAALEAILGLPPLHLHIQQEALAAAVRLKKSNLWRPPRVPHTEILYEAIGKAPLIEAVTDKIPKQFVFDKKYKIQLHEEPREGLNPRELRIFTDGSKTRSGTGSGVFSEDLNIHISTPLGAHNTVFQAECMGIIMAAHAIVSREVRDYPIRILSDSRSVLQALQSYTFTSGLIYECHRTLTEVCTTNSVTLQWIKGHSNSRGNDGADILARRGSEMKVAGPEPILPLPYAWLRNMLRYNTKVKHQQYWSNLGTCRQAKEALPTITPGLSKKVRQLKRPQLRLLVGAITGHAPFNKHLFTLGVTDSPSAERARRQRKQPLTSFSNVQGWQNTGHNTSGRRGVSQKSSAT
ncbi:uncharacterized protein LOC125229817 [Leguminivora glycinivorella]|uniref:uncharacterized protein LOC125229817 n=1 Tax=Leguminivora glycinivorella TaxID=1035111 RepID=UPI00200E83DC|nr:uncharacterized protein LOC125229817 [Leguminivora glycinivorella]